MQDAGQNHYWISGTDVPYKFELGGPAHEGCAGIVALTDYLSLMASGVLQDVCIGSVWWLDLHCKSV